MNKLRCICVTSVFTIFLSLVLICFIVKDKAAYSETEKRKLQEFPQFSAESVADGSFTESLEDYISDRFPARNVFMGISAYSNLAGGRNCAQDIYHCSDGYLINAPKAVDGEVFRKNISRFETFAAENDIPASLVIIPSAGYMMEDVLPLGHGKYRDNEYFEEAEKLTDKLELTDVRSALAEGLEKDAVYYHTDHHLTAWGSYNVYRAISESKNLSPSKPEDYNITRCDGFYGTTWSGSGYWLTKGDSLEIWDRGLKTKVTASDAGAEDVVSDSMFFPENLEGLDKYPVYLDGNHSVVKIENPAASGGHLLMVRDSYAHCIAPFLAENYSEIYLIDLRYFRNSVSDFIKTNNIDEIMVLYGMDNLLTDTNSAWLY